MKKYFMIQKLIAAALLSALFLATFNFLPLGAHAQSDTSVVIQPSKIEITASPSQKLARSFSIINRSNFNVRLKLVVKDYKQISENGGLRFYDSAKDPASSWLVPQYLEIGLKPLETKDVGIVINVPQNISGGGHYGAILFQPAGDSKNIGISNFGELVLLTVSGNGFKNSSMAQAISFKTSGLQQGGSVDFNFKVKNTGNTHFDTNGKLILQNWLGKQIGNFDISQMTVYPNTTRLFTWRWTGTPYMGVFKSEVLLRSGQNQALKPVGSVWFVIVPWQIMVLAIFLALCVLALIKYRDIIFGRFKIAFKKRKSGLKARIRDLDIPKKI